MILKTHPPDHVEWQGGFFVCALGRNGITTNKHEGDDKTPTGMFRLVKVFYRADRLACPKTNLPVQIIQHDDGWCDDPSSPYYNQFVKLPFSGSYENMWRDDHVYDVVVVTDHNQHPIIPFKGSAIFIHVARLDQQGRPQPTAGCLALKLDDLLHILKDADEKTVWEIKEHYKPALLKKE